MLRQLTATALIALGLSTAAPAATLLVEYDANNAIANGGTFIPDSAPAAPAGNNLLPTSGSPTTIGSRGIDPTDYAAPLFHASGAGFKSRAFFDFPKFGLLNNGNIGSDSFNVANAGPGGAGDSHAGYSYEAYVEISGTTAPIPASVIENSGLGFGQDQGGENQFLMMPNINNDIDNDPTATVTFQSNTAVSGPAGGLNEIIDSILPRNVFFHVVKVEDPFTEQVRWYINGLLALTDAFPENSTFYGAADENLGNVGQLNREVRGVKYSLTRFYQGVLTDPEISALNAQFVPEPTSAVMVGLGVMGMIRRGRR